MDFEFKKSILLTGAGFTSNIGGFLGKDLWLQVFNNLNKKSKIKDLLIHSMPDFESVYFLVTRDDRRNYSDDEIADFNSAIHMAYEELDRIVRDSLTYHGQSYGIFLPNLIRFIGSFAGSNSGDRGALFTLNQDLFLERYCGIKSPLFGQFSSKIQGNALRLTTDQFERLPNEIEMEEKIKSYKNILFQSDGDSFYFKLHGSYGWLSSDGSDLMVLGGDKVRRINSEPLLKWYYEIFQDVLFRTDVNLLVIGYSFGDRHINDLLKIAIDQYGLQFCILSPHIENQIKNIKDFKLENGINKIFKRSLSDLFPKDQGHSLYLDEVMSIFPNRR